MPPLHSRLHVWLLGNDRRQALRASQSLLVLAVYVAFAVVQHLEVLAGLIDEAASWPLTAWGLTGGLLFYGAIRSGLNLRLQRDRALAVPQMLWAMVSISWSYAITGQARGAVILIMMVTILYGVFTRSAAESRRLSALGFCMLGAVMAWKAWTDPQNYEPRVEAVHLFFAGIVLTAVSILAVRIGAMRLRLEAQRGELSRAVARIQALATRDELTGLLNRRAVLERLQVEFRERECEGPLLCVALIDLDHFKRVNDSFGHAMGDEVLRRFAAVAGQEMRSADVLARWGGEEFLVVLPGVSAEEGLGILQRIRERLLGVSMDDIDPGMKVTFSAGVAVCRAQNDVEQAIERADAAMYCAKKSGRGCSMMADVHARTPAPAGVCV